MYIVNIYADIVTMHVVNSYADIVTMHVVNNYVPIVNNYTETIFDKYPTKFVLQYIYL